MGPSNSGKRGLVADINVTPLVDVMLVLLIIFMVTAPMMTQGLNVDLPETTAKPLRQELKPLVVTLKADGAMSINEVPMTKAILIEELKKSYATNKDQSIYIRADKNVPYGNVMTLMADIQSSGFDKISMVTKPPEKE
jgi:biopolymer transport protein TolR